MLIMEYLEGGSLADYLKKISDKDRHKQATWNKFLLLAGHVAMVWRINLYSTRVDFF